MRKKLQFSSIQMRIAVTFSTVILGIIVISIIFSYRFSFFAVRDNSLQYTYQLVQQISNDIDSYIKYMQDISQMVTYNNDVKEYLSRKSVVTAQQVFTKSRIAEQLNSITLARNDITYVAVLGKDGRYVLNKEDLLLNKYVDPKKENWYIEALEADGLPVISSSHVQNIFKDTYTYVVSLSRALKDKDTGEISGVILVDLNYNKIRDLCSNISLGKRGYIFIVDDNGDIVYHPQQQLIYSALKYEYIKEALASEEGNFTVNDGNNSRIYTVKEAGYADWKIVGVTYVDELVLNGADIQTYYILVAIIFLFISTLLASYLALRISRPIKALESSMKEIEKGNFNTKVALDTRDEIGQFAKNFAIMTKRIKALMAQISKDYELKRKYELKVLQDQINPHFLYNTLDSIIWMSEMGNNEEVVLMTSSLAKLLRISLSKGSELITIEDEIKYIESYLTIQKMRYKDKMCYDLDISPEILKKRTLKLILQPIVENAIYHGIKNKDDGGNIKIKGFLSEDKENIILQVIDTGVGISEEDLRNIFDRKHNSGKSSGLGINNVNDRIKLYFGKEYGIAFESVLNEGTTVTISIPVLEEDGINDSK